MPVLSAAINIGPIRRTIENNRDVFIFHPEELVGDHHGPYVWGLWSAWIYWRSLDCLSLSVYLLCSHEVGACSVFGDLLIGFPHLLRPSLCHHYPSRFEGSMNGNSVSLWVWISGGNLNKENGR